MDRGRIIGEVISAVALILVALIGWLKPAPRPPVPAVQAALPPKVKIVQPTTGDVSRSAFLHGKAWHLHKGQLVWLFSQVVYPSGTVSTRVYPLTGPCTYRYGDYSWACRQIQVGSPSDARTFQICAAVLTEGQAHAAVRRLLDQRHPWIPLSAAPYLSPGNADCIPVHRVD